MRRSAALFRYSRSRSGDHPVEYLRGFASFDYAAGSWRRKRRVIARLEATPRDFDARYIVTSLAGEPRHLYEGVYCTRGQTKNLIKKHKSRLASRRAMHLRISGPPMRSRLALGTAVQGGSRCRRARRRPASTAAWR